MSVENFVFHFQFEWKNIHPFLLLKAGRFVILNLWIFFIGRMDIKDADNKKFTQNVRRPFAVAGSFVKT